MEEQSLTEELHSSSKKITKRTITSYCYDTSVERSSDLDETLFEESEELTLENLILKAKKLRKFLKNLQHLDSGPIKPRQFQCSDCGYKTVYRRRFVEHLKVHSSSLNLFQCPECSFSTGAKEDLLHHRSDHAKEKKYACEKCDYKTSLKGSFAQHLDIHEDERRFVCPFCDYRANRKWNLTQHILIHEKRKEGFACHLCNYKTNIKSRLKNHSQNHKEEKKLACPNCHYKTFRRGTLHQHMLIHTTEKRFHCSLCHYKTNRRWSLKKHFNVHSEGRKILPCSICGFIATSRENLKQHRKIHYRPFNNNNNSPHSTSVFMDNTLNDSLSLNTNETVSRFRQPQSTPAVLHRSAEEFTSRNPATNCQTSEGDTSHKSLINSTKHSTQMDSSNFSSCRKNTFISMQNKNADQYIFHPVPLIK